MTFKRAKLTADGFNDGRIGFKHLIRIFVA